MRVIFDFGVRARCHYWKRMGDIPPEISAQFGLNTRIFIYFGSGPADLYADTRRLPFGVRVRILGAGQS